MLLNFVILTLQTLTILQNIMQCMLLKEKLWDKPSGIKTLENDNLCSYQPGFKALIIQISQFCLLVCVTAAIYNHVGDHYISIKQMLHICVNYINTLVQ